MCVTIALATWRQRLYPCRLIILFEPETEGFGFQGSKPALGKALDSFDGDLVAGSEDVEFGCEASLSRRMAVSSIELRAI